MPKAPQTPFGTFDTPSVSAFGETIRTPQAHAVLFCHDEIVVECVVEQAEDVRTWLESAMVEGMDAVLSSAGEVRVPVEVEVSVADNWGEK